MEQFTIRIEFCEKKHRILIAFMLPILSKGVEE